MQSHLSTQTVKDDLAALRREAGAWLKEKRESAGLSQRELAARIGIDYYTFISQIEAGRGKVPAERYEAYAEALGLCPRVFCKTLLRYLEPILYRLMFAHEPSEPGASTDSGMFALEERLRRLEAKLGE